MHYERNKNRNARIVKINKLDEQRRLNVKEISQLFLVLDALGIEIINNSASSRLQLWCSARAP